MDWDPFETVPLDDEADRERERAAAIERARSLDARVATCTDCGLVTNEWIVRRGLTGEGLCRPCVRVRDEKKERARAFMVEFKRALAELQALRAERAKKLEARAKEVPF